MSEPLLSLLLRAPLIGIRRRWPNELHAVNMDGIPVAKWPNVTTVSSVCGKAHLKLVAANGASVEWPPNVRSLPKGMTRCLTCHEMTGRKRPRSSFVPKSEAAS